MQGVEGCLTQGSSIKQARARIKEALGLYVDDAESSDFVDNFVLPVNTKKAVAALSESRRKTAEQSLINLKTIAKLAKQLSESSEFSTRDMAEIPSVFAI